ncbi:MAG: glucokinase [Rhodanobacteraceae bacterium]|nr:MAG: glucokinase [Rhodanobacteraceae bacterium]
MSVVASHLSQHASLHTQPFLAADVGGTHARVALVRAVSGGARGFEVLAYRKFACVDFPGLPELLKAFVDSDATLPVRRCVIACAGQVIDDTIINDNLAWRVRLSQLRETLAFDDVALLNDFEALGYALDDVRAADSVLLCGPDERGDGAALVVGPGTGLGAAVRLSSPDGPRVLATEAGQMDFAPGTVREREVLAYLGQDDGYVPYERILSGPGLLTLYSTLCALRGQAPRLASPEAVTAAACAGSDAEAVETVDLFCAALGGFVGNLAMAFMADGGVYLAGGVLPEIRTLLQHSHFAQRFLSKGGMRKFLQRVPVRLIEHGRHGVLGAAHWYLDQHIRAGMRRRVPGDGTVA